MKRKHLIESDRLDDGRPIKRKKMVHETSSWKVYGSEMVSQQPIKKLSLLDLNSYCLLDICGYLSNIDMINICIASDRFREAILNCDLRGRVFDFNTICSCHILNAFKIFGQHMTNIKISERDIQYESDGISRFDEILRLISTYCSVDTIKHLNIQYYNSSRLQKRFIYKAIPYFRHLESFTIAETDGHDTEICIDYFYTVSRQFNKSVNNFVERVLMQALNINSIKMNSVKITGRFLHLPLSNLKKLQFIGCNLRDSLGIMSFLKSKPNLLHFTWINSSLRGIDNLNTNSSVLIFETATENLAYLEMFEYNENDFYITKGNKFKMHQISFPPNEELINKFQTLKKLAIDPITSDLCEILKKLETFEELAAFPHLLYIQDSETYRSPYHTEYKNFRNEIRSGASHSTFYL